MVSWKSGIVTSYDIQCLRSETQFFSSLDVKVATDLIIFNTAELQLGTISVLHSSLNEPYVYPVQELVIDKASERATIKLPFTLPSESIVKLKVGFEGEINDSSKGYFRSSQKRDGQTTYYAVTQLAVCYYPYTS